MTESDFSRSFGVTQPVIPALNYRSPSADELKLTLRVYGLAFLILANATVPSALHALGLNLTASLASFGLGSLMLIGYIAVIMGAVRIFFRSYSSMEHGHG